MKKEKNKKKLEWTHRIICFVIFESLISTIGFAGLHYSLITLIDMNKLNFFEMGNLMFASLGIAYLEVANFFYWIFDENLFDFKKLWRKE